MQEVSYDSEATQRETSVVPVQPSAPTLAQQGASMLSSLQSTFMLTLSGGRKAVPNVMGKAVMVHTGKGIVYFQPDKQTLYEVVEIAWDGPHYQLREVTDSSHKSKTREGRKGRLTGAFVGTLLAPGIGTVMGAAMGTGKKSKTAGTAHSETYAERVEVPAPCRIILERLDTRAEVLITTNITSEKAPDLLALVALEEQAAQELPAESGQEQSDQGQSASTGGSVDIYEELKKAKELLDLGILTQQEFDARKAALLNQ